MKKKPTRKHPAEKEAPSSGGLTGRGFKSLEPEEDDGGDEAMSSGAFAPLRAWQGEDGGKKIAQLLSGNTAPKNREPEIDYFDMTD